MTTDGRQYGDVLQAYKWLREGKVVQREGETKSYRLQEVCSSFVIERKWDTGGGWSQQSLDMLSDWDWLSDRWMVAEEGMT